MKFTRAILPNISIAFTLAVVVLMVLNRYNPRMGFLQSAQGYAVLAVAVVCSLATAIVSYSDYRNGK